MGGTFDPPHIAHLIMAEYVRDACSLSEVIFIPTGNVYYKNSSHMSSANDRYNMVKLAIEDNPAFSLSSIERDYDGISYTAETLEKLKSAYPDTDFFFIVGADSLDYIENWKDPGKIFKLCKIIAVNRKGISTDRLLFKKEYLEKKFQTEIQLVDMPLIDVSSTMIRERIKSNLSVKYLLPSKVIRYINEKGLYKNL